MEELCYESTFGGVAIKLSRWTNCALEFCQFCTSNGMATVLIGGRFREGSEGRQKSQL